MTDYSLTADESAEVRLAAFSLVFVRTGGRVLGGIGVVGRVLTTSVSSIKVSSERKIFC
jgi:hypothetical protein